MQPSFDYGFEGIRQAGMDEASMWFKDLTTTIAKLDLDYKNTGIAYHRISPSVRDQVGTGTTARRVRCFEYGPGHRLDDAIQHIRGLDNVVQDARVLLRCGSLTHLVELQALRDEATQRITILEQNLWYLKKYVDTIDIVDDNGNSTVLDTRGLALFYAMAPNQRNRFYNWTTQLREVQIGRSLGSVHNLEDTLQVVLGEEERFTIEWPDVADDPLEESVDETGEVHRGHSI